jgi:phage replication O-like protein O
MASPQIENGHIDIATTIVDKFCSYRLSGQEWQIVWVVLRKTWGWLENPKDKNSPKKKIDRISLSQFEQLTEIDRRKCHELLKKLVKKKVLKKAVTQKGDKVIIRYGFQKDFDKWLLTPKKVTIPQKGDGVSPKKVSKLSPKKVNTKETLKETFTKEIILPDWLPLELWNEFKKYRTKIKKPLGLKAQQLNLAKLEKLKLAGNAPQAVIEQTLEKGWQGFFELPENKGGQHGFQSNNGKTSAGSGSEAEELGKYSGLGKTMLTE